MEISEIIEEDDEGGLLAINTNNNNLSFNPNNWGLTINTEGQKERIRQIIQYQRSLYLSSTSSSSFSSSGASCSSVSSSRRSSTLLELMKGGSTSLRRLFDMEHTSLANHFENYSGSPITKAIPLWDTDTDNEHYASWTPVRQMLSAKSPGNGGGSGFASGGSFSDGEFGFLEADKRTRSRRLARTKSFRRLPGFKLRRYRGFRFRFRFRRLRIMICGQKF